MSEIILTNFHWSVLPSPTSVGARYAKSIKHPKIGMAISDFSFRTNYLVQASVKSSVSGSWWSIRWVLRRFVQIKIKFKLFHHRMITSARWRWIDLAVVVMQFPLVSNSIHHRIWFNLKPTHIAAADRKYASIDIGSHKNYRKLRVTKSMWFAQNGFSVADKNPTVDRSFQIDCNKCKFTRISTHKHHFPMSTFSIVAIHCVASILLEKIY